LAIDDPWDGFVSYLENLFRVQAGDRGFNDFLSCRFTEQLSVTGRPSSVPMARPRN
jgi:hypothetical protein